MRERLLCAPAWVLALLSGGVFGVLMALNNRLLDDNSSTEALITGSIMGVFFGAFMGPITARDNRRVREAAGYLPPGQLGRAVRLARRGAVPEDQELRRAARRIAQHRLSQVRSQRWWALPVSVLAVASNVWIALRDGEMAWLGWLGAAFFLGLIATHLLIARRLVRRAELLAAPPD